MECGSCGSACVSKFESETSIHFSRLKDRKGGVHRAGKTISFACEERFRPCRLSRTFGSTC